MSNSPKADKAEEYVCSECGADVSIEDNVCPKCGAEISEVDEESNEDLTENGEVQTINVLMPDGETIRPFTNPKEPIAAMILSIIPGVWQLINNEKEKGIRALVAFFLIPILYFMSFNFLAPILPILGELALIIWSMSDAYITANRINTMEHYRYEFSVKKLKEERLRKKSEKKDRTKSSIEFIDSIRKCYELFTHNIYSDGEYSSCKNKNTAKIRKNTEKYGVRLPYTK